jgi:hypothetical protein
MDVELCNPPIFQRQFEIQSFIWIIPVSNISKALFTILKIHIGIIWPNNYQGITLLLTQEQAGKEQTPVGEKRTFFPKHKSGWRVRALVKQSSRITDHYCAMVAGTWFLEPSHSSLNHSFCWATDLTSVGFYLLIYTQGDDTNLVQPVRSLTPALLNYVFYPPVSEIPGSWVDSSLVWRTKFLCSGKTFSRLWTFWGIWDTFENVVTYADSLIRKIDIAIHTAYIPFQKGPDSLTPFIRSRAGSLVYNNLSQSTKKLPWQFIASFHDGRFGFQIMRFKSGICKNTCIMCAFLM